MLNTPDSRCAGCARLLPVFACVAALVLPAPTTLAAEAGPVTVLSDGSGHIDINDARLTPAGAGWQLDARAEIRLSPVMRAGLDSGVPLEFVVTVALRQPRDWWLDRTLFAFEQRYTLTYYELTRHYRLQAGAVEMTRGTPCRAGGSVSADDSEASSRNYRSLLAALDEMGTLRGIALSTAPSTAESPGESPGESDGNPTSQQTAGPTAAGGQPTDPTDSQADSRYLAGCPVSSGRLRAVLAIRLDDRALPLPLQPVFSSTWRLASEEYVWPVN